MVPRMRITGGPTGGNRAAQGCKATICMPPTTTPLKVDAVRRLGAEIELVGATYAEAQVHAQMRAAAEGKVRGPGAGGRAGAAPRLTASTAWMCLLSGRLEVRGGVHDCAHGRRGQGARAGRRRALLRRRSAAAAHGQHRLDVLASRVALKRRAASTTVHTGSRPRPELASVLTGVHQRVRPPAPDRRAGRPQGTPWQHPRRLPADGQSSQAAVSTYETKAGRSIWLPCRCI